MVRAQIYNPFLVRLIAVTEGGRKEELDIHDKFKDLKICGEWFEPKKKLFNFIKGLKQLDVISIDFHKNVDACDDVSAPEVKISTRSKYESCCRCKVGGGIKLYKEHKDGNTLLYCKRCSLELAGKLGDIKGLTKENAIRLGRALKPCIICNIPSKPLRKGRCHSCNEFFRRNGTEWSESLSVKKEEFHCIICNKKIEIPASGKCHACYEFFRRNGFERSVLLGRDQKSEDINKLKNMTGKTTMDKAKLLRKLYVSNDYTNKFLVQSANTNMNTFQDIIRNVSFVDVGYVYRPKTEIMKDTNKIKRRG